jgi:predicted nucleic acid-binding protein
LNLVLDANVIAKWFNQERWSDRAARLKDEYVQGRLRLVEPTLALYEVANAIRRNPQLNDQDAREACLAAANLLRGAIETPSPEEASAILVLARSLELTYYDASYVHLAQKHRISFISADHELVAKASKAVRAIHLKDL